MFDPHIQNVQSTTIEENTTINNTTETLERAKLEEEITSNGGLDDQVDKIAAPPDVKDTQLTPNTTEKAKQAEAVAEKKRIEADAAEEKLKKDQERLAAQLKDKEAKDFADKIAAATLNGKNKAAAGNFYLESLAVEMN